MTTIVAYRDKANKVIHMAGDKLRNNTYRKYPCVEPKIFGLGDSYLIGVSGCTKVHNVLAYMLNPSNFSHTIKDPMKHINVEFIPHVMLLLKQNDCLPGRDSQHGHHLSLLVAYSGKIFQVAEDLSVVETKQEYSAVGSGSDYALGALAALQEYDLEIKNKLKKSLQAANKFDLYTGADFTYHQVNYG